MVEDKPTQIGAGVPAQVGHYRVVRLLGEGGMGSVYEAVDDRYGTHAAIKFLHPTISADSNFRERFEREAHLAVLLRSPYSVRVLDSSLTHDPPYLVMEYIEGRTLASMLAEGPMPPRRALQVAADIARALEEAHGLRIIHRDIKPENVMITTPGTVKLTDFGIARRDGGGDLSMPLAFIGSPKYAAPEQAGGSAVDHRVDLYSLGALLYHMLAGKPPYSGTREELAQHHQHTPLPTGPLTALPRACQVVVERAMSKDPDDRYQTATDMVVALERAIASLSDAQPAVATVTPTVTPPPPAPPADAATSASGAGGTGGGAKPPGRRIPPALAIAGAAVVLLGGGVLAFLALGSDGDAVSSADHTATARADRNADRTRTARARTRTAVAEPTDTATPTASLSPTLPPGISAGEYTFNLTLVSNTCTTQNPIDTWQPTYAFTNLSGGDFLAAGDSINVTRLDGLDVDVGDYTFTFPTWKYAAGIEGGEGRNWTIRFLAGGARETVVIDEFIEEAGRCFVRYEGE